MGVVFGPINYIRQATPVRFVYEVRRKRLSAGDDEAVELSSQQLLSTGVELRYVPRTRLISGNVRQGVKRQSDQHALGRRVEKRDKLMLCCIERSVRHVVDQSDGDALAWVLLKLTGMFGGEPLRAHSTTVGRIGGIQTDWH